MNRILTYTLTVILTLTAWIAEGKDSLSYDILSHRVTAEIRPSYNLPTHYFYRGGNPSGKMIGPGGSFHLKYSFSTQGSYQGIGLSINTFNAHDLVGTPAALYIFQGARLFDLSPEWSFGYEWNLGLSYGWKPTDVVISRSNIYINVGLPFTWRPSSDWEFQIGPEYTHFSNGDTMYPNGGANTFGLRIGASRIFGNDTSESPGNEMFSKDSSLEGISLKDRIEYDIFIYGAWRAGRILDGYKLHVINRPFALGGICINPLYRINKYFLIGPSLDIQADRSIGLHSLVVDEESRELTGYSIPDIWKQTSCGFAARGELEMPFFSINIGAGYNVIRNSEGIKRFYTTYNLKARITKKMYICIGYRLSAEQYTHNLMLGMGFRI